MIRLRAVLKPIALSLAIVTATAATVAAQPAGPAPAQARKVTSAPRIDGKLDDAAWKDAPTISGFKQREPDEGAEASESTTVRVLYDEAYLYVGRSEEHTSELQSH